MIGTGVVLSVAGEAIAFIPNAIGPVIVVATIAEDLPADGRLALEDEVLEVDGKRTEHVADIVSAISDRTPGDTVRLTVERKGREREVEIKTTDLGGGRAGIGIALEPKYDYPYEVRIDAGDVGGPSAGMMFSLAVIDKLTPGALTGGTFVAGTGTINEDGKVDLYVANAGVAAGTAVCVLYDRASEFAAGAFAGYNTL